MQLRPDKMELDLVYGGQLCLLPGGPQGCGVAGAAGLRGGSSRFVLHGNELLCPLGLAVHCRQGRAAGRPMALWGCVPILGAVYDLHGIRLKHFAITRCQVPGTPAERREMQPIFGKSNLHGLQSLRTCHARTQLTDL